MLTAGEIFVLLNAASPAQLLERVDSIDDLVSGGYLLTTIDGDSITALTPTALGLRALVGKTLPETTA
jgi:hypothetical protein